MYPTGSSQPSITGNAIKIYRGWPQEKSLNADLAAGISDISVFQKSGHDRAADLPIGVSWQLAQAPVVTLTASSSGNVATYGGTPSAGHLAQISAFGQSFSYLVTGTDTLATLTAALGAIVNTSATLAATVSGDTIAITTNAGLAVQVYASVSANASVFRELARREGLVTISIWSPNPTDRDTIGAAIDAQIAGYDYLTAPDGTAIKTELDGLRVSDSSENATLYRRDRDVRIQYSIVNTAIAAPLMSPSVTVSNIRKTAPFADDAIADADGVLIHLTN